MTLPQPKTLHTVSHWGVFRAECSGKTLRLEPIESDSRPTPNIRALERLPFSGSRILWPAARKAFLEGKTGEELNRGRGLPGDEWVRLSWSDALKIAGKALNQVYDSYGPSAVFGESYGWKSSGSVNAATYLVRRLLTLRGGYVHGENNYSNAAMRRILPYVIGKAYPKPQSFDVVLKNTERLVLWGADPSVTNDIDWYGATHTSAAWYRALGEKPGVKTYAINPLLPLTARELGSDWIPVPPGTDCALMLGMIHALVTEKLAAEAFIRTHVAGWEKFLGYVLGKEDGVPKTPGWAEGITGVPAARIRDFALDLARHRTLLVLGWGPQRATYGEQFHWMGYALAAALGQLGLPGGGLEVEYHTGSAGDPVTRGPFAAHFPVPKEPALPPSQPFEGSRVIPVARFVDAIEHPGKRIRFDGADVTYPDIRAIVWAGGNPFAHQPDTMRLERVWGESKIELRLVVDSFWTATAKHADIVLPAATFLERNDLATAGQNARGILAAMNRLVPPQGESRSDYEIFSGLARELGIGPAFTEGLSEEEWLRRLYRETRAAAKTRGTELPSFDDFWKEGLFRFESTEAERSYVDFAAFRKNPLGNPLATESGKIELWSNVISGFSEPGCPPHPSYLAPGEGWEARTDEFPLSLVTPKSTKRLHAQLDPFANEDAAGVQHREPLLIHPKDAAAHGITEGDLVLVRSRRGAALAEAKLEPGIIRGVVALRHGAWFDPEMVSDEEIDVHGNANTLTPDEPTSGLACGNVSNTAVVSVARWTGSVPPIRAFDSPKLFNR